MKNLMRTLMLLAAVFFFSQCDTEEPSPETDEELITTMTLTFTPVEQNGEVVVFRVFDEDADGPIAPVYTTEPLAANVTYTATIQVLNEAEEPVENITEEIEAEDEEHQFFFDISNGLNMNFAYADADADGNPVGLTTFFTTGEPSTGTLTVELRHEPNKTAEGVKSGDPTNAGGETDIQTTFDVVIR